MDTRIYLSDLTGQVDVKLADREFADAVARVGCNSWAGRRHLRRAHLAPARAADPDGAGTPPGGGGTEPPPLGAIFASGIVVRAVRLARAGSHCRAGRALRGALPGRAGSLAGAGGRRPN